MVSYFFHFLFEKFQSSKSLKSLPAINYFNFFCCYINVNVSTTSLIITVKHAYLNKTLHSHLLLQVMRRLDLFLVIVTDSWAAEPRMCTECLGTCERVWHYEPAPLWKSAPAAYFPPCTCWSGHRIHAQEAPGTTATRNQRANTYAPLTQRPRSYRWAITDVMAHWWSLGSPPPRGDDRLVFPARHWGRKHLTREVTRRGRGRGVKWHHHAPVEVLVNKLQLFEWELDTHQRCDLSECIFKRFDSCDFVFCFLFRGKKRERKKTKNKPPRSTIEHNAPDLWPPDARLSSAASPLKLVGICQWKN